MKLITDITVEDSRHLPRLEANPGRLSRVASGNDLLSNAAEWVDWRAEPVQVEICDHCWHPGCSSNGYIHLSRSGDLVLWTDPQQSGALSLAPLYAVERHGGLAFSTSAWAQFREAAPQSLDIDEMPTVNARAVLDSILEVTACADAEGLAEKLGSGLVACTSLDVPTARSSLLGRVHQLQSLGTATLPGAVGLVAESTVQLETLYVDTDRLEEWPVLARRGSDLLLALGPQLVWLPT